MIESILTLCENCIHSPVQQYCSQQPNCTSCPNYQPANHFKYTGCQIGDTLYYLSDIGLTISKINVDDIRLTPNSASIITHSRGYFQPIDCEYIGDKVFYTKEEAKVALSVLRAQRKESKN